MAKHLPGKPLHDRSDFSVVLLEDSSDYFPNLEHIGTASSHSLVDLRNCAGALPSTQHACKFSRRRHGPESIPERMSFAEGRACNLDNTPPRMRCDSFNTGALSMFLDLFLGTAHLSRDKQVADNSNLCCIRDPRTAQGKRCKLTTSLFTYQLDIL